MGISPKGESMADVKVLGSRYWSIGYWSVDPDSDEAQAEGPYGGDDFPLDEEAQARVFFSGKHPATVAFIELVLLDQTGDGPDQWERVAMRANPDHDPSIAEREAAAFDAAWRRECAMEAGMGMGVDAYNDAMGWGCEPYGDE